VVLDHEASGKLASRFKLLAVLEFLGVRCGYLGA
jgi:hypothetical protein